MHTFCQVLLNVVEDGRIYQMQIYYLCCYIIIYISYIPYSYDNLYYLIKKIILILNSLFIF